MRTGDQGRGQEGGSKKKPGETFGIHVINFIIMIVMMNSNCTLKCMQYFMSVYHSELFKDNQKFPALLGAYILAGARQTLIAT